MGKTIFARTRSVFASLPYLIKADGAWNAVIGFSPGVHGTRMEEKMFAAFHGQTEA